MRKNQRWATNGNLSTYPPPRTLNGLPDSIGSLKALIESNKTNTSNTNSSTSGSSTLALMSGFMSLKLELREVEGASLKTQCRLVERSNLQSSSSY